VTTALRQLADAAGIVAEYAGMDGGRRLTSDDTRSALLHAMGLEAGDDASARDTLTALRRDMADTLVEPVAVVRAGTEEAQQLQLQSPPGRTRSGPWRLVLRMEDGQVVQGDGVWRGEGPRVLRLPTELPLGYHDIRLELHAGGDSWQGEQRRIVVPAHCPLPSQVIGDAPAFGITANLYTLRSGQNWGVGDLRDLRQVAQWAAQHGADFVGLNPLHALLNRGTDISPYSPVSRLFRNAVYLDIESIPELQHAPAIAARVSAEEFAAELAALRQSPQVRYEQVMGVKGLVLDALFRTFLAGADASRTAAYHAYVLSQGAELERFATWMTLAERHGGQWRQWPQPLQQAGSVEVRRYAEDHRERMEFHRWVQFELDRQLGQAQDAARQAGMRIGLYQDLAIGTSPSGADVWAQPSLFVQGVTVGAPPDPYSATGQDWGLPPLDPRAMRRDGYRYFSRMVREALRHSGALRIDHVMGLFRLFWIPAGLDGTHGAYVRYPSEDLLGILALESVRAGALVVGEDLGTVPPEVPPAMERWGILSSAVLQFERDARGFRPVAGYPRLALTTPNTHDMAPTAGWWGGRDIELRHQVGLLGVEEAEQERRQRQADRDSLVSLLHAERTLPQAVTADTLDPRLLVRAVTALMSRSPSVLTGVSLDDATGERDPVNVPGVGPERYPSWTRRMAMPIEEMMVRDSVAAVLASAATPGPLPASMAQSPEP
jgi:4-alpha-glucanotransferase